MMPGQTAGEGHREAMISHLARDLKDRLVRALFTQRSVLLANEQAASRRVQEMEERLARLQPAIAERIRGYEERIEALEKDIAVRDAETRDLIRAKLVLARKELEAEISRNRIDWN
jgi:chromosome segregation ATPase